VALKALEEKAKGQPLTYGDRCLACLEVMADAAK